MQQEICINVDYLHNDQNATSCYCQLIRGNIYNISIKTIKITLYNLLTVHCYLALLSVKHQMSEKQQEYSITQQALSKRKGMEVKVLLFRKVTRSIVVLKYITFIVIWNSKLLLQKDSFPCVHCVLKYQ